LKIDKANEITISVIADILENKIKVTNDSQLIGGDSLLDSMKLVEVCIKLEDIAEKYNFEFDWTSESTMSRSRSMFRSVATLAEEFARQSDS
tara:strand:- start:111 stop:386 length:276 start_codon:yes stop_codon:yes gene_type:complete